MSFNKKELLIEALYQYDNKCYLCGLPFNRRNGPTIDHIKPLSKGGGWEQDNLAPCHKKCNVEKSDREFIDGILEPKLPKRSSRRAKSIKRTVMETFCYKCLGGRLLQKGEMCITCMSYPGPQSGRWYLRETPDQCTHYDVWCKSCSSGIIERDIPIKNLV